MQNSEERMNKQKTEFRIQKIDDGELRDYRDLREKEKEGRIHKLDCRRQKISS